MCEDLQTDTWVKIRSMKEWAGGYVWDDRAGGFECGLRMMCLCGRLRGGGSKAWSFWEFKV